MYRMLNIRYKINDYLLLIMIMVIFNHNVFHKEGCLFVGLRSRFVPFLKDGDH